MSEPREQVRRYVEAWNRHDVAGILDGFVDDCVYEDAALGRVSSGKEQVRGYLEDTFGAFPDFHIDVVSLFGGDQAVFSEWDMSGTHSGDFPGLPATGGTFRVRGCSLIELDGGRIRRNADYWNLAEFLSQVGVLVPSGPSA